MWCDGINELFNAKFIYDNVLVKGMSISVQNDKIQVNPVKMILHSISQIRGTFPETS